MHGCEPPLTHVSWYLRTLLQSKHSQESGEDVNAHRQIIKVSRWKARRTRAVTKSLCLRVVGLPFAQRSGLIDIALRHGLVATGSGDQVGGDGGLC